MDRATMQIFLAVTLAVFWLSSHANAFTLRLGTVSGPEAVSTSPALDRRDLPSPQLFQMAVHRHGLTVGVVPPSTGYQTPQTEIHYQDGRVSEAPDTQDADRLSALATTPRLSGAELLLLRQTQMVADR